MGKIKSIQQQIADLEEENVALFMANKGYEKIANMYCKQEFGYSVKEIHQVINDQLRFLQKRNTTEH